MASLKRSPELEEIITDTQMDSLAVGEVFYAAVATTDMGLPVGQCRRCSHVTGLDRFQMRRVSEDIVRRHSLVPDANALLRKHSLNINLLNGRQTIRRTTIDEAETKEMQFEEGGRATAIQIAIPFFAAGLGMVAAGVLLHHVLLWKVFREVSTFIILVPALLGLKGNLEMTMAARMSTEMNTGRMDTLKEQWILISGNLALTQCQATVVAFLASLFAIAMGVIQGQQPVRLDHSLLLTASALITASVASLVLGAVMSVIIISSKKLSINPDNVSIPIAASLGDITTLALLAGSGDVLYTGATDVRLYICIVIFFTLFVPLWVQIARGNVYTRDVIGPGWVPIISAMFISSAAGSIMDMHEHLFPRLPPLQPVIAGVAGNLVATQSSRISTFLYAHSEFHASQVCVSPVSVFLGKGRNSRTARILLALVIPGHLIFTYFLSFFVGQLNLTVPFLGLYLLCALFQVTILLYLARCMVFWFWQKGLDTDSTSIPYLTALGDLLGVSLLTLCFYSLRIIGDPNALPNFLSYASGSVSITTTASNDSAKIIDSFIPATTFNSLS
ncbi:solute carrier family 41 member 1-like [Varroa jacobsoni]|uniref:solute carrier family 41 member 1-like n=1 Tax=Varroa jacobsoni TaxID=62625 RepID=UPI000BF6ECF4|nr:solute carrier family 41 member 1-like [Varroa jacobsoni]